MKAIGQKTSGITYHCEVMPNNKIIWKVNREKRASFQKYRARLRSGGVNVIRLTSAYVHSANHGYKVVWWQDTKDGKQPALKTPPDAPNRGDLPEDG